MSADQHKDLKVFRPEPMETAPLLAFGIFQPAFGSKGAIVYIGLHETEADVWQTYLGWPSEAEIEIAKSDGYRIMTLHVTAGAGTVAVEIEA